MRGFIDATLLSTRITYPSPSVLNSAAAINADAVNVPANPELTDAMKTEIAAASAEAAAEAAYAKANSNKVQTA